MIRNLQARFDLSVQGPRRGAWRAVTAAALAALLACGLLLLAGCGEDDQHVAESFPSGARPAPVPAADAQAAAAVQLPPVPPAEPQVAPAAEAPAAAPGQPAAAGEAAATAAPGEAPAAGAATPPATPATAPGTTAAAGAQPPARVQPPKGKLEAAGSGNQGGGTPDHQR